MNIVVTSAYTDTKLILDLYFLIQYNSTEVIKNPLNLGFQILL